jgi:hypothetical protein
VARLYTPLGKKIGERISAYAPFALFIGIPFYFLLSVVLHARLYQNTQA